jgi:predicted Zn-ribbon and HTH transcriptional regulator
MPATVGCLHGGDSQPGADRPSWEVADIFRLYGDTYRQTQAVSAAQQKVIDAIIACRTAQLGGHAERCAQCGFERYAYSSCRNRHCPTCQTWATAQWVEAQRAELLPTPYFHTVFTVPHALNALILDNKRLLLTLLFRTVSQTLLQFGQQNLGGQLGATMVLHTWDQTLNAHFHLHCLVPAGALAEDGLRWVPTHPRFLFPVRALSTVFRAKFLTALQQAYHKEALSCAPVSARCGSSTGFTHLLDQLYNQAWVVYAKRPCAGPTQVLDYLGRYIHRVAIANHRLLEVRDGRVRFTYHNRRQGNQVQTMTLEAHEFIRRFLLHIVPRGFQRLRHVGFLANRCKARALRQCRHLLGQPTDAPPRAQPSAVEWMRQRTGIDLTQCPQCGPGPLVRSPLHPLTVRAPGQEASSKVPIWDSS